MNNIDEPTLTRCDLCQHRVAALPGPRWRRDRAEPPAGYLVGFVVEQATRQYVICRPCLDSVLHVAA